MHDQAAEEKFVADGFGLKRFPVMYNVLCCLGQAQSKLMSYIFLIAGGGIAGLSAALVLARQGHAVTVVEQAAELSEIGAGIQLGPNAMRILQCWGLGKAILDAGCGDASA